MKIAVCWKWVTTGGPEGDSRWAGVSPADEAALELALTIGSEVTVVCAGPPDADAALRTALAVGAAGALRIDVPRQVDSRSVARSLAPAVDDSDFVLCGDYSLDRGTGSVPSFLAHELGFAQALGLVELAVESGDDNHLRAVRRLDGGRREVLAVTSPAVLSVEGSVARLRRAALTDLVAAKSVEIESRSSVVPDATIASVVVPYRPRARTLPPPAGALLERVRTILDIDDDGGTHGDAVILEPADAAQRIVDQLVSWGYLTSTPQADTTP